MKQLLRKTERTYTRLLIISTHSQYMQTLALTMALYTHLQWDT